MATVKGQNLRILIGDDEESLKCVAAATQCQMHAQLDVQEDTTKDDEDWVVQIPVGISWDVTVDALVLMDDEETGATVDELQVGAVYTLRLSQTEGAAGEQNRDAIANALQMTGQAILSDLQINAQNGDISTYTAKFTGNCDLTPYTPPTE